MTALAVTPDLPVTAVGVVVPARNEQDRITRCLASLRRALAHAPDGVATAVAVVLDRDRRDPGERRPARSATGRR